MAEIAPILPNTVFSREDLMQVPGAPEGIYVLRCPPGAETILSPKSSGNHEIRPMSDMNGPDEQCKVVGDLVYFWQNSGGYRYAWRLAE